MAYTFQQECTISENVQRIITEQIEKAKSDLTDKEDIGEGIHTARTRFKKVRGVLRLVRPALGDVYQQENRRFRDAGRMLAEVRDAEAMIETVDKLCTQNQENPDTERFHTMREVLVERHQRLVSNRSDLDRRVEAVLESLEAAQHDMDSWPYLPEEFDTIGAGLKKTYKRGRKAMQSAFEQPTTEAFHNWRKRVKYSTYHVRLLKAAWPTVMKSYRSELKHLSDLLGDDHDLAVLCNMVNAQPEILSQEQDRHILLTLITQQQEHLRSKAWLAGKRIYAPRPRAVMQSAEQYWNARHHEIERAEAAV